MGRMEEEELWWEMWSGGKNSNGNLENIIFINKKYSIDNEIHINHLIFNDNLKKIKLRNLKILKN